MLPYPLIQFGNLDDLIAELHSGDIVRVVPLDITTGTFSQVPGLRVGEVGVHVRAITANAATNQPQILSCYLPLGAFQIYNRASSNGEERQPYNNAWDKADALQQRVVEYLTTHSFKRGFEVKTTGIIHLGDIRPLKGRWHTDPAQTATEQTAVAESTNKPT